MAKIVDVIIGKNGDIFVKTKDKTRVLYKDKYGYFCRNQKIGGKWLVDRFLDAEDIEKIETMLEV